VLGVVPGVFRGDPVGLKEEAPLADVLGMRGIGTIFMFCYAIRGLTRDGESRSHRLRTLIGPGVDALIPFRRLPPDDSLS
jgi:hypothetical protein